MKNKTVKTTMVILVITALVGTSLTGCGSNAQAASSGSTAGTDAQAGTEVAETVPDTNAGNTEADACDATQEANDEVKQALFAYDQAYYPYDFTTEDGGHDGYEVAVLKAIDELLPDWEFD